MKDLKLANKECSGVRVVLTDRDRCAVVDVGIELALTLRRLYPNDFKVDAMARLLDRHRSTITRQFRRNCETIYK